MLKINMCKNVNHKTSMHSMVSWHDTKTIEALESLFAIKANERINEIHVDQDGIKVGIARIYCLPSDRLPVSKDAANEQT